MTCRDSCNERLRSIYKVQTFINISQRHGTKPLEGLLRHHCEIKTTSAVYDQATSLSPRF